MHEDSYDEMKEVLHKYLSLDRGGLVVADIGSFDVNGTYRDLIPTKNQYIGVDLNEGPNVDKIMLSEFEIPINDNSVDAVLCGQVLEHCRNPFKLTMDMARILKPRGWLFLVAPFRHCPHYYPIDCFRYLPQGMEALIMESGLNHMESYFSKKKKDIKSNHDCWGIGQKP